MLTRIKRKLATIRTNSWRWHIVNSIWASPSGKACTFYWVKLPSSILAWIGIGIVGFIFVLAMIPITLVMVIGGYYPIWLNNNKYAAEHSNAPHQNDGWWYERDFNPITGKTQKIKTWYVVIPLIVVGILVVFRDWVGDHLDLIFNLGIGVALGLAVVGLFGYLFTRQAIRKNVKNGWNKICPELEVKRS